MSSPSMLERARARNPFPHGAVAVGMGLAVAGLTIYVFLAVAARTLGAEKYSPLAFMWTITFLAAPGFFFPIEQEIGRALADRRVRGVGGLPVVKRAALLAGGFVAALTLVTLAASGALLDEFLDNQVLLLAGFLIALASSATFHLGRGTLSGNRRFGTYGLAVGMDGVTRMVGALALAIAGVATAGPYGLVVGLSPLVAISIAAPKAHELLQPGPEAGWRELSRAFGYLLVGSVLAQAMINMAPLIVAVLADTRAERELIGATVNGLLVARVPVFFFQAIQASLIPELAAFAAAGEWAAFRARLARLLTAVVTLAVASTAASATVGPWVVRTFFGREFELTRTDMAYLAAASGAFMFAMALAQALIAIAGYRRAAAGWVVGMVTLFAVTAFPGDILIRAERGFLFGSLAAAAALAVLLIPPVRHGKRIGEAEFTQPGVEL